MRKQQLTLVFVSGLLAVVLVVIVGFYFPFGPDWREWYRPAGRELLAGRNPHELANPLRNPTWTLIPLLPLAPLPMRVGGAIFLLMSLCGFAYSAYRLGASPLAMGAFIASPPVLHCLLNGNIDWIPLLGATLPPPVGLFFVTVKPQIGMTIALFWLVEAWRKGGARETLRVFAPVTLAFLATLVLFGFWVRSWTDNLTQWWNASLFPWSVPLGVYWMVQAIRKQEIKYALPAGPCLSPYVLFHSWSAAVIAVVASDRWALIVSGALWALVLFRAVS